MSEAIRADWYDIDEADRPDLLDWLHGTYLPALQGTAGVAWVGHYAIRPKTGPATPTSPTRRVETDPSVPAGGEFVLLVAASAPDPFLIAETPIARLEAEGADRLGRCRRTRRAVFVEECRIGGPQRRISLPGTGPAPAIQLGNLDITRFEDDLELARFYRHVRFPQAARSRGCIGARKLLVTAGWGKHGVLYEFDGIDDGEELFEMRFEAATPPDAPTRRHVLEYVTHSPTGPCAGPRIWPE